MHQEYKEGSSFTVFVRGLNGMLCASWLKSKGVCAVIENIVYIHMFRVP